MVATQFAYRRCLAVAIVAIFLMLLVPATPVQAQAGGEIYVRPGQYTISQSSFAGGRHTHFIDNGTGDVTLTIPVFNEGPAIANVPVAYWFHEAPDRTDCAKINLPQGSANAPSNATATFTLNTRTLPPGAYNITVDVYNSTPDPHLEPEERCAAPVSTPTCVTETTCAGDNPANNQLRVYFVKEFFLDLKIREVRWCAGGVSPIDATPCNTGMLRDNGAVYNVTPPADSTRNENTYFEVIVENVANKPHSWANVSNYGGPCMCAGDGFAYELNITVTGPDIVGAKWASEAVQLTKRLVVDDPLAHRAWSVELPINGLAGVYNVTTNVDPQRLIRRHLLDTAPDILNRTIEVAYRDFTGNFTASDFRTVAANAYPYSGFFTIGGGLTFKNIGPAGRGGTTVAITVYLDNESWTNPATNVTTYNSLFRKNTTFTPQENFSEMLWSFEMEATSNIASDKYLPPGKHTLYAHIDVGDVLQEPNETLVPQNQSNNVFSLPIYVQDTTRPTFGSTPVKLTLASPQGNNAPTQAVFRPREPMNIYAEVSDDDESLNVTAVAMLVSNTSVTRNITLSRVDAANYYHAYVDDMMFHNFSAVPFNGTENWTLSVRAVDSFNNNVTSAAVALRLKGWPIHNASADHVVRIPTSYPNGNLTWNGVDEPTWDILVEPNMTGFTAENNHQQFKTANLAQNITFLSTGITVNRNGSHWSFLTAVDPVTSTPQSPQPSRACDPYPPPGSSVPVPGGTPLENSPGTCDPATNNTFRAVYPKDEDAATPGMWNYSIRITDIANYTRVINGTLFLEDLKPIIHQANLSNVGTVVPPGDLRVQLNASDDNKRIDGAYLNLSRTSPGDGAFVNITLTKRVEEASGGESWFVYNDTIDVKRGSATAIGLGGAFNVSILVVDDVGNWEKAYVAGGLNITDADPPTIGTAGVHPAVAEVGENVTFYGNASDATNVTMKLEVFKSASSQELLFDAIFIPQPSGTGAWNYTHRLNITAEGIYGWRLTAIDSVNIASAPATGTLLVRDNLGPKYDVRSPSLVVDGERYGSGTPRIEVVVQDVEGVIGSSVEMEVAGLPVDFELLPAPGNLNGFLVSYTVPANKKFSHRDLVEVNLTARDNSTESLTSFLNFTFIVDDVSPTVRLVSVTPSYRDQPAHVLNISLASRITLAAEDVDNIPTQVPVGGIRYRILGGGTSAETVYSGPFRIDDAAGVYTGPRLYQIQFWAEDDVGNFNRNFNVTTVYVDDTPPALFQFFPQGRNINATFVDDRVGVNRSVVWYRVNDQSYTPLGLTEREGAWTIALPEGVKGDRVSYYLQAWDRLENTETFGNATSPYASFDVSNHEPRLRITAPIEGSRVSRTFDLTWEASDEDGDALVFTIYYRQPGRSNFIEMTKIENTATRRYSIDTLRFPDGEYTFRVAAGDGGFVKLAESRVTVLNRADPIGSVSVSGDATPGGDMLVKAEVTKAEATVEARLYLKGTLVGSYAMNDAGRDGDETANDNVYSVRVPIEAAGDYRVEIFTQYREDGELRTSRVEDAYAFSAKLTPGYILAEYGAIIALIGLLAAVGIGVAVFMVMRRR